MNTQVTSRRRLHVISKSGQWAVTRQGASRASKVVDSREGAVREARRLASGKAEIIVHRADGTVVRRIAAER